MAFPRGLDKGLLEFCLAHSDGTTESVVPHRDPKDYEWLKEAMDGIESDVKKMKKCLDVISDLTKSEDERKGSLELLQFYVEDLDNAEDLFKIQGFQPLLQALKDTSSQIRFWACWTLASLLQNHATAQSEALKFGTLEAVLDLLSTETDQHVRDKSLSVLSGLTQNNKSATKTFVEKHGLKLLLTFLCHPNPKTRMKAVWFIRNLALLDPAYQDSIRDASLIPWLVMMVNDADPDVREKAQLALIELTHNNPKNAAACNSQENLQENIQKRLATIKELPAEQKRDEHVLAEVKRLSQLDHTVKAL